METLRSLPDMSGRKFGTISLGYDRIDKVRTEFGVLESLAALVLGCDREAVTVEKVSALLADVQIRAASMSDEEKAALGEVEPRKLLAAAVALAAQIKA